MNFYDIMHAVNNIPFAFNFSFPESQGDALMVEVQDSKGSIEGRTTIPVSSLNDNPVCIHPVYVRVYKFVITFPASLDLNVHK